MGNSNYVQLKNYVKLLNVTGWFLCFAFFFFFAEMAPITTISQNYEILRLLGQGSYGRVFKCLKLDTKETVAIKVLKEKHVQPKQIREVNWYPIVMATLT